jgi:hypothetical protein
VSHASDSVERVFSGVNSLVEHFNVMHGRESAGSLSCCPLPSVVELILTNGVNINPVLREGGVRVGVFTDFPEGSFLVKVLE